MKLQECASFSEAAGIVIPPQKAIESAWADIRTACDDIPVPALKKRAHDVEVEKAMTRAMQILELRFGTPSNFRQAIPGCTFAATSGVNKQLLYHFASKWTHYEDGKKRIQAQKDATSSHAQGLLAIFHNKPMTAGQLEEAKKRKHQKRETKKRVMAESREASNT